MQRLPQIFRYKLPFVIAGFVSMSLSIYLWFVEDDPSAAIFVGLWVPSIHSLGALLLSRDPDHGAQHPSDARSTGDSLTSREESWS